MPPISASQKTRERIIDAAAALFRSHGYTSTGIDSVMATAGLTHGGFYAHFRSKVELLRATIADAGKPSARNRIYSQVADLHGLKLLEASIDAYLSMEHRNHPECGCPIPTLGAEVPRLGPEVRTAMSSSVMRLAQLFAEQWPPPGEGATARAQAFVALLVGGMVTARTLSEPDAERWLEACRDAARRMLPAGAGV